MLPDSSFLPMANLSQFLSRIAHNDEIAFHSLYRAVAPVMHRSTFSITNDIALADIILRDTFVDIWQKAADYDANEMKPLAWLARIQHEQITQHLDSKSAQSPNGETRNWPDGIKRDALPLQQTTSTNGLNTPSPTSVQQSWMRLVVAYASQLGWREIANVLGMPRGEARSFMRAALFALKAGTLNRE